MPSNVIFNTEAQKKLLDGIETLYEAVSTTLGPRGRNVAIAKANDKGQIWERVVIHDGVSVAKEIDPADQFENLGASIVREAAQKQVDEVGDGTTAVIVLAYSIIAEATKEIAMGVNPMIFPKLLEEGSKRLCNELDKLAKPIKTLEQKKQIANISAEDNKLGDLIAETLHEIGDEGVLTVEESKDSETVVEKQEGMQLDKGYAHWAFITDPQKMTATITDAPILVTDRPMTSIAEWGKFLNEEVFPRTKKLIIISPEISGDLLEVLLQNKVSGNFLSLAVPAPSFGDNQTQFLQDIAILTGAKFIAKDTYKIEDLSFDELGKVAKITSTKNATIISANGHEEAVKSRVKTLRDQLKKAESDFYAEKIKERLGKLTNGIAVLRVGGQTEIEMRNNKEKAIDAIAAVRAACKEGIVPGGEVIYLRIREQVKDIPILYQALAKPFNKLMENSGFDSGEMREKLGKFAYGYAVDVTDGIIKNTLEEGIIDPVLVSKMAIKNAISVSSQIITTGCCVVPTYEKMPKLQ